MPDEIIVALSAITALGSALIGCVYFTFSAFAMAALRRLPAEQSIAAMQSINRVILRSFFIPVFLGTAVCAIAAAALAMLQWHAVAAVSALLGAALYVIASLGLTIVCNVPLNNQLDAFDGTASGAAEAWEHYDRNWTFWKHVRTVASLMAAAAFVVAIACRS